MLKLSDSFNLQSNQVRFGTKYDSTPVTAELYSNGSIKIASKQNNLIIDCSKILSICFYQTKKGNNPPGVEIYLPDKTYLLINNNNEIVNKWFYSISHYLSKGAFTNENKLTMNIIRRKGYGITDDWEPTTIVVDDAKLTIFSDCDLALFRYRHAYTTFSKIVFKKGTTAHPNQIIIERKEGREVVFSHPSYNKAMELMNYFKSQGLTTVIES